MEYLGKTLKSHIMDHRKPLSRQTVCNFGIQMISIFERLHETGKVYNDLKPDNILFSNEDAKWNESLTSVSIIDFGLCTDFKDV